MVERLYAQEFSYDGKRYKIAFQSRVNPDQNGHFKIISASETGVGADYWLSQDKDDVRVYGILIREVGLPHDTCGKPHDVNTSGQPDYTCSLM